MRKTLVAMLLMLFGWGFPGVNAMATQTTASPDAAGAAVQPSGPPPQAVFLETTYHFDTILEGQEITHDFIVENKGPGELIIYNVRPD